MRLLLFLVIAGSLAATVGSPSRKNLKVVVKKRLPLPQKSGGMALTEALARRRSVRSYTSQSLTASQISQLLWAAQGVSLVEDGFGYRTSPSAGALFPLEFYVLTVDGHYHFDPDRHTLTTLGKRDIRNSLWKVSLEQKPVKNAPVVFVVTGVYGRTAVKYGATRSKRYVMMEAGHACENLLLQATALGLGGVSIGAFDDEDVQDVLDIPVDHEPLYVVPVGYPA